MFPTLEQRAWIGGFVEGEGCFSSEGGGRTMRVFVQSTDRDAVERLEEWSGLGKINGPYRNGPPPKYRDIWRWVLGRPDRVMTFVVYVWPYLGQRRREQAARMLVLWRESQKT